MSPAQIKPKSSTASNAYGGCVSTLAGDNAPAVEVCPNPAESIKRLYSKRGDRFAWQLFYRLKKNGWKHWDILEKFIGIIEENYLNAPASLLWKLWNSKKLRQNLTEEVNHAAVQNSKSVSERSSEVNSIVQAIMGR